MALPGNSFSKLPAEILASILSLGFGHESDLVYLWTTVRNVDHRFRHEVEEFVRRTHLKRSHITYRLRLDPLDFWSRSLSREPELWLCFKGVNSSDPCTAVFVLDVEMGAKLNRTDALPLLQAKLLQHPCDNWFCPPHMLSVQRHVNDTELCGFQLVISNVEQGLFEVRLDWKATLSNLLIEEKLRQKMSKRWMQTNQNRLSGLSERPLHENQALYRTLRLHLSHWMNQDDSFSSARWKRIKKQTRELDLDFSHHSRQKSSVQKLNELERHISLMNQFSFDP